MRNSWRVCASLVLGLLAVAGIYVVMALDNAGVAGLGAWLFAAAFVLLVLAVAWICLPARSDVPDGSSVIQGSLPLAAVVSAAVVLGVGGVASWGVGLLQEAGPGGVRVGGLFLVMVLGALGALGAIWRVATGRSRLARIDLDDEGVHYRGSRTRRSLVWTEIGSIALADRHRRLVIRPKRADVEPLRISTLVFDVPPTRLLAVVEQARPAGVGRTRNPRRRSG